MIRAVTFDYGQTLAELDMDFLARRVSERGAVVGVPDLERAAKVAWPAYDDAKRRGETAYVAWSSFMGTLLGEAGVVGQSKSAGDDAVGPLVEFLWSEQPRKNLWRRPIRGMKELVEDLSKSEIPLGIVSNSEGRLAELLDEMGLGKYFPAIADSGKLGYEKPDERIFAWTAERLGVAPNETVHVGDAWAADIDGALGVGACAIWFTPSANGRTLPEGVFACSNAEEVRSALGRFGVRIG
jgi:putative hydrolase of the HAD superfamily